MKRLWHYLAAREDGYTLVETLVAMVLLTTVLIPLGVSVGTLLLDREGEEREKALLVAERSMTNAVEGESMASSEEKVEEGFRVSVVVESRGSTRDILISVFQRRPPGRVLIRLHKTVVSSQ